MLKAKLIVGILAAVGAICALSCKSKPAADVPRLVVISPHNKDIEREFEEAFAAWHAETFGEPVTVEWRDVGGGSSTILTYLKNIYSRGSTSGIDIAWGGGETNFIKLADEGLLTPMTLAPDVLANIPPTFGGLEMIDPRRRWCGSAISGFGLLYNRRLLEKLALPAPQTWDDLAGPRLADQLALADPTQSGTALAAYEMIVQSAPSWPQGWAKLLAVLGNARKFYDSAGGAADAPMLGEAPIATSVDFYGALRVAQAPDTIVYVSPRGQTAFSPDPIAILKNPPHPQAAQRFVDFVLSRRGQALWALRAGEQDGPRKATLGRQPIRKDVYAIYAGRMSPWTVNPYQAGNEMTLDVQARAVRFDLLKCLIRAAAIDNRDALRAARRKLIASNLDSALVEEFNRLPDNVATMQEAARTAAELKDAAAAERITSDWAAFFRQKYRRILQ